MSHASPPPPLLAPSLVSPHHLSLDSSSSLLISLSAPSLSMIHFILHPVARVMFLKQSSHLRFAQHPQPPPPSPRQPIKKQTKTFWMCGVTPQSNISDSWKYGLYLHLHYFLTVSLKVIYIPYHSLLPKLALRFPICTSLSLVWNASSTSPLHPVEIVTVLFSQFPSNGSFSMRFSCAFPSLPLVVFCLSPTALPKLCSHILLLLPCYVIRP